MEILSNRQKNSLSCDQWLDLFDELNIGAFTVDLNHKILSMNHAAQSLIGLKQAEVVEKDCREIFTGVPCLVNCVLRENGGAVTAEPDVRIKGEDEATLLLTRVAAPIYGPDRNISGCLTILQDHSPIVDLIDRINYEERSLKIIMNNLDIGVFTVNRGGHITFFNKEAEKITGYDRSHMLGKLCSAIFEGDGAHDLSLLKASISDGDTRINHRGMMTTNAGEVIPVKANYLALKNEKGAIVGGLATFHDLTLIRQLKKAMSDRYTLHDMIGKGPAMQKIFKTVGTVAQTDATVLIEGETGTGKDLLAKVIHSSSKRSGKPFVKVNCSALPDNLLESEMFGYVKGAFTGADRDKPGRFNEADQGTIFLDEIGDLPLSLQAKLLRVLEDKEFYPLGSPHTKKVDIRIISATNRGLGQLVNKRLFREDLFYRLNVFRIELPALKDRWVDLPILIPHILRRMNAAMDNRQVKISENAMEILLNFDYPGNVRELENILEHALIVCRDNVIRLKHLPDYVQKRFMSPERETPPAQLLDNGMDNAERQKILHVLSQNSGHRAKTAKALDMDRTTLWRKMKRYGIGG